MKEKVASMKGRIVVVAYRLLIGYGVVIMVLSGITVSRAFVYAQPSGEPSSLVPCDGVTVRCNWPKLIELGQNIMEWLIFISPFVASGIAAYAGVLWGVFPTNTSKRERAVSIFRKLAFWYILFLGAWLVFYTLTNALLEDQSFQLLDRP